MQSCPKKRKKEHEKEKNKQLDVLKCPAGRKSLSARLKHLHLRRGGGSKPKAKSAPSESQRAKRTPCLPQSARSGFPVLRGNVPQLRVSASDLRSSLSSTGGLQSVRWVAASVMRRAGRRVREGGASCSPSTPAAGASAHIVHFSKSRNTAV